MKVRRNYIRQVATDLLTEHGLMSLPIDVSGLIKRLGITVKSEVGAESFSGISFHDPKSGKKVIGVNSLHSITRQRFTLAHELGHFRLHSFNDVHVSAYRKRDPLAHMGIDPEEIEANCFAAELLMPVSLVLHEVKELGGMDVFDSDASIKQLAKKFKVSSQAMSIRLSDLGLLAIE